MEIVFGFKGIKEFIIIFVYFGWICDDGNVVYRWSNMMFGFYFKIFVGGRGERGEIRIKEELRK